MEPKDSFRGINLRWPFDRCSRPFVVRIVEPRSYKPSTHAELFGSVITDFLGTKHTLIDKYASPATPSNARRFDLMTFPEAFVPAPTLISSLEALASYGSTGCIHVGLRPSCENSHLFSQAQALSLIGTLRELSVGAAGDLAPIVTWLGQQASDLFFNLGCLFMVDAEGVLRICVHPKVVRSQFETSPLPELHMAEADVVTLVTLQPIDKKFSTINLQPLICSDALNLPTDKELGGPLTAINRHAGCFGEALPDHVDIVSVATCTPQQLCQSEDGSAYRDWHGKFQDTFLSTASHPDYARHHFCAIVLANFQEITDSSPGGLSGLFLPVPPRPDAFPDGITLTCWGRKKGKNTGNNRWSSPEDEALQNWDSRGFIANISPSSTDSELVRVFGTTIQRLPRENSLWTKPETLTQCEIRVGIRGQSGEIAFKSVGKNG